MKEDDRLKVALWRFALLGPLVSARRERGELQQMFRAAAERTYERWDGIEIRLEARTFEEWYYRHKKGGLDALKPQERSDAGVSRVIRTELAARIVAAKEENPRRSIRRIIRMLERAGEAAPGELKKSTVHRLLRGRGISARPQRYGEERLGYRMARAGDLWMGDVMHGPRVLVSAGRERKSYLHLFIDSATSFVPGCAFRLGETAVDHEAVFKQTVLSRGLPRGLYLDRGAAQTAGSLKIICAELSVHLLHCRPYDPAAKGAVERIFQTIRAEILDELPEEVVELTELNSNLWSWLSVEYHRRVHGGSGKIPLVHWLSECDKLRRAPHGDKLTRIFLHRERRKVRKDGTVRFQGRRLEVRGELRGQWVELRFEPNRTDQLPDVYLDGKFYCDTVEQDLVRNSQRRRRTLQVTSEPMPTPTGLNPLRLIQNEHERRSQPPATSRPDKRPRGRDKGQGVTP